MKWFKHYTDASSNDSIALLEQIYGYEGYGVYWKILEYCAAKYDGKSEPIFVINKLKIRSFLSLTQSKIEKILTTSDQNNLFSVKFLENNYEIYFPKLAEIKDNHSKNLQAAGKLLTSNLPPDKNRIDKDKEKNIKKTPDTPSKQDEIKSEPKIYSNLEADPSKSVLEYYNAVNNKRLVSTESNLKQIKARLKEKYSVEDMKKLIDHAAHVWAKDDFWKDYNRPSTLFNQKFGEYLDKALSHKKSATEIFIEHLVETQKLGEANVYDWAKNLTEEK